MKMYIYIIKQCTGNDETTRNEINILEAAMSNMTV